MTWTAFKTPSADAIITTGDAGFNTPTNAYTDDSALSSVNVKKNGVSSDTHRWTGFGFTTADIPSGATINGIEVVVQCDAAIASTIELYVNIYDATNGVSTGQRSQIYVSDVAETDTVLGGVSDLWGETSISDTDVRAATFGVQLYATNNTGSNCGFNIDVISIRVDYTAGATTVETDADATGSATINFDSAAIDSGSYTVNGTAATNVGSARVFSTEATSSGTSSVSGDSQFIRQREFNIAGSSTTSFDSEHDHVSNMVSTSSATVSGFSAPIITSIASADGLSTVSAQAENANAAAPVEATGTSDGTSTIQWFASWLDSATFTESNISTVTFTTSWLDAAVATSDGAATTSIISGKTTSSDAQTQGITSINANTGKTAQVVASASGSTTISADAAGLTGVVVNPTEFDWDNSNVSVTGSGFGEIQGTVYLSDANTLAGSVNEVEISNAISSWADTSIALNFTTLTQTELDNLEILGPGQRYLIIVTDGAQELASEVLTVHRPKAIALSDSSFIPASGADTTPQLTPPAGKTVADFGGGRIQDDENPTDPVNAGPGAYREDEWALIGLDASVYEKTYEFRVLVDGVVVDTISVTPELTISSGTTGVIASSDGSATVAWYSEQIHGVTFTLSAASTTDWLSSQINGTEFTEVSSTTANVDGAQTNNTVGAVSGAATVQGYSEKVAGVEFSESGSAEVLGLTSESIPTPVDISAIGSATTNFFTAVTISTVFAESSQATTNIQDATVILTEQAIVGSSTTNILSANLTNSNLYATGTSTSSWYTSVKVSVSFDIAGYAIVSATTSTADLQYDQLNKFDLNYASSFNGIPFSSIRQMNDLCLRGSCTFTFEVGDINSTPILVSNTIKDVNGLDISIQSFIVDVDGYEIKL